ncbi:exonuclease SbcCD subunit D C-terminal domain-containing protein [Poseidonibacter lekithochrous]|uniref:exonuclease SbcCD subunit D C-terminal domain-containing protein n=1 Tax=Poseidonibacter lekithochrous TaxID=1904463 RepID=UPI000D3A2EB0|nr:exonuclease SbcCD subunit D C-terminal domain-containing protein [Poseidonibacter lekithochrous]
MKVLHTSDWHIGQKFMGKSREEEHKAFLSWVVEIIKKENIDVLIVAGDIFDTGNPPNYALELYYNFLKQLFSIENLYVIITAGNHDSISTLKAPKQLLEFMNVHVITSGDEDENELIAIYKEDKLQGVVCAVPFLRDSIVRKAVSGQTINEKESSLNTGIKQHYIDVYEEAIKLTEEDDLPIIATGHLTTVGSRTSESERDIYIGGTLDIGSDFLGKYFDYVALGHLHINQTVGSDHVRYSGSPIPLSFSEANQKKKINIVEFKDDKVNVEEIEIPLYRKLEVLKGNLESVIKELNKIEDKTTWIEIHLNDDNPMSANQEIREFADKNELIILAIKIDRTEKKLEAKELKVTSLDELTPSDVFTRRLDVEELEDKEFVEELTLNFKKVYEKVSVQ